MSPLLLARESSIRSTVRRGQRVVISASTESGRETGYAAGPSSMAEQSRASNRLGGKRKGQYRGRDRNSLIGCSILKVTAHARSRAFTGTLRPPRDTLLPPEPSVVLLHILTTQLALLNTTSSAPHQNQLHPPRDFTCQSGRPSVNKGRLNTRDAEVHPRAQII